MPPSPPRDPADEIEAILRDAITRILAVVEAEQRASHESVRSRLSEAARSLGTGGSSTERMVEPTRGRRIRTEDVVHALREVFAGRQGGLRIAELRQATGFGDMQLHRALLVLEESGEIERTGPPRKTVYRARPTRGRSRRLGPRAASAPARVTTSPLRRPPRAAWVSTPEVAEAVERALRGRRQGLRMGELCEATGYTDKQVHRALASLTEEGRIRRSGTHREMRYRLVR